MTRARAILVLYCLSGGAGLAWQVLWVRLFTPVFGAGVEAIAAVTALFLGGLGLGGHLAGRWLRRTTPLRLYALLEALVGLWGLALPWAVLALRGPVTAALALTGEGPAGTAVRLLVAGLLVAPPAVLLGGTFPAVAGALHARAHPHRVGLAYGLNALGAAAGALAAGLWMPWALGVRGASIAFAAVNLSVAGAALVLARGQALESAPPAPANTSRSTPAPSLWWLAGLTGFTGLAFEVTWSRLSGPLLSARYAADDLAFAIVLAAVLVGIGLGGVVARRASDRAGVALAGVQLGLAVLALAVLEPVRELALGPHRMELVEAILPALPALCLGASFPLLSNELLAHGGTPAGVGRLYAVNTAGAVLGSLLSGFLLVPMLGAQRYAVVLAGLAVLTACVALARDGRRGWAAGAAAVGLGVTVAMGVVAAPIAGARLLPPSESVLAASEGRNTTTLVSLSHRGVPILTSGGHRISGGSETGPNDQTWRARGPARLHRDPKRVLAVGLGTGETARAFLDRESLEELVVVELDENQPSLLPHFGTQAILDDPRLRLVLTDGRHFLRTHDDRWDVITVDAFGPRTASATFYTADFYREARARLRDDGVLFVKFYPYSMGSGRTLSAYLATFFDVFEHGVLVQVSQGLYGFAGSPNPSGVQANPKRVVADGQTGAHLMAGVPRVTDDRPVRVPAQAIPNRQLIEPWVHARRR